MRLSQHHNPKCTNRHSNLTRLHAINKAYAILKSRTRSGELAEYKGSRNFIIIVMYRGLSRELRNVTLQKDKG